MQSSVVVPPVNIVWFLPNTPDRKSVINAVFFDGDGISLGGD